MSSSGIGILASSALIIFMLAITAPRLTSPGDSRPDAYWRPSSMPTEIREENRDSLAARDSFRRESLGWKFSTGARSSLFDPCRSTEGPGVDANTDGLVDNLTGEDRWKKEWSQQDPAVTEPDWSSLTPSERLEALRKAQGGMGLATDFWRNNEPAGANCDQLRGAISKGPYYWGN